MAKKKQKDQLSVWHRLRHGTRTTIHKNMNMHKPWEKWVDAAATTILTLLFTWLALHSTFTGNLFRTVADTDSPELIDLYTGSARNTGVPKYSDIIVMPIDGCSRQDVTTALEILSDMNPKAIGLDVIFPYYADGDEMLLEAIMSNGNIVMASCPTPHTYFESILREEGVTFGSVVFDVETRHDIVRSFKPAVYSKTDTIWSFELQLARMVGADVARFHPYDEQAYILYSNIVIDTLNCKELIATDADLATIAERVQDKIVLIGDITSTTDFYRTPVDADMPGLMIHAYALDTLLHGHTISVSPKWFNWLIACIVCAVFSFLLLFYKWGLDDVEGLALRVSQIVMMILIVVIPGVWCFWKFHWYFDFTPTFLALAIQAVVLDIWVGLMAIAIHFGEYIHPSKNNK